jgi:hypothetical protein
MVSFRGALYDEVSKVGNLKSHPPDDPARFQAAELRVLRIAPDINPLIRCHNLYRYSLTF